MGCRVVEKVKKAGNSRCKAGLGVGRGVLDRVRDVMRDAGLRRENVGFPLQTVGNIL